MKSKSSFAVRPQTLNVRGRAIDLSTPVVMGIMNITPDSFFSGSRFTREAEILRQAERMLSQGATFIDVGGYSSRPGAEDISVDEETARVTQAVRVIVREFPAVLISVDTFRAEVARKTVEEGAVLINDISAGELDSEMFQTIAELNVPYSIMHMRGTPQTMNELTRYENLIQEVVDYFTAKISRLKTLGVTDVIIDPGFGFAKTAGQSFEVLTHLEYFRHLEKPILAGLSRKSMIWKTLGVTAEDALNGTTALNMAALLNGASILRVHDVKEAAETIKLFLRLG